MGLGGFSPWRRGRAADLALPMQQGADAPPLRAGGHNLALRAGVSLTLAALFIWLLSQRLVDLDFAAMGDALSRAAPQAWAAAAVLTGTAFWAVGRYDALLHRHFETGVAPTRARAAGISAIAVSQVLGMGVVTGAILRWRMLPEHSFWLASRITLAVAVSFLAGWAVVSAAAVLVFGPAQYQAAALGVLGAGALGVILAILRPPAPFRWPNLFTIAGLIALCAVDTLAAAGALFVMLPPEVSVTFATLLPAFLLAYGAGLLSGTPGGIGAFELALLALLPPQSSAPILAAVIGWRLVYFVLPAIFGAAVAIGGARGRAAMPAARRFDSLPDFARSYDLRGLRVAAEIGLMAQGQHQILAQGGNSGAQGARGPIAQMISPRGHIIAGLLDPICAPKTAQRRAAIDMLAAAAKAAGKWPALYKVGHHVAAAARAKGWRCLRLSREGVIALGDYDLAVPARAGLRRKLRRAQSAGVTVQLAAAEDLPLDEMQAMSRTWARAHGGERGFSMGVFQPDYVAQQKVCLAHMGGRLVAFVTFHYGAGADGAAQEWTLDIMRHAPDVPDGTVHALIHAAIVQAKTLGLRQLSLAAVPEVAFSAKPHPAVALAAQALRLDSGDGLRRFKDSFAPDWQGRYICAPSWLALALASASIWRAVLWDGAGRAATPKTGAEFGVRRHYQFALPARIWQSRG